MSTAAVMVVAGSADVGLGHVRRSLALASAMKNEGIHAGFVLDGPSAAPMIEARGFPVYSCRSLSIEDVPACDVVVLDSYDVGLPFAATCKTRCRLLVVIEDLPHRALPADLTVDVGDAARPDAASAPHERLVGVQFALLDEDFSAEPRMRPTGAVDRILVTLGATDLRQRLVDIVSTVCDACPAAGLDVIVGPFVAAETVRKLADQERVTVHVSPPSMRALMLRSALAISAAGHTLLELAACGVPTLALQFADNQAHLLGALSAAGAVRPIGDWKQPNLAGRLQRGLQELSDGSSRAALSVRARRSVDGLGAKRVATRVSQRLRHGA